jgi:nucleoside-diphosphate-sugar epimerase
MIPPADFRTTYAGARALVFGASGFVGRRVAQALSQCGAVVYPVVRSRSAAASLAPADPSVCEVPGFDLRDEPGVRALFERIRPAITFNLAGYGINPDERDEETAHEINAVVPMTIARAAHSYSDQTWSGQQMIHAGSALEYGTTQGDLAEDSLPQPSTLYGRSKLEGTRNLASFASSTGLRASTARLFMVYGPGERQSRLLPSLIRVARTGEALDLTDGMQRRDFTYLDDAVEGLLRLGVSAASPGEVINVATGKLTSVREFAEIAAKLLRISPELLRFGALPRRSEEMCHENVNVVHLRRHTSWIPSISPTEGISRTVQPEQVAA